ncbi:PilZ domain-containing protein [Sphingomonas corticis]|uniref:PilZ domain-containing protein n=1 Tax=Sphingomonas corticis TaxID=2722791 RepID=A0ABX1CRJ5_9SPHN|nr:PilZ domain-containing protein [Sphingomonas corticis]NJR78997.1 PilZ domain-containing protein [Sphingomonas corticis]
MRVGGAWSDVVIHNVSSRGLMAGCDDPPALGSYVEIRRGGVVIIGRVQWMKHRFFGIRTQDRISVQALIREPRQATRPRPANDAAPPERRSDSRLEHEASMARRVERSRAFASAFQYLTAAVVVLTMAGIGGSLVYDALSRPAAAIEQSMRQATR